MPGSRPRGRTEVVEALLHSARRLIASRGPSSVALREVADDAGVNFGLLYQYIGTKDQLLRMVFERAAADSALRLHDSDRLDEAIDSLMQFGDGTTARLIGWAALEGDREHPIFGSSPTIQLIADLAERNAGELGHRLAAEEAQVFAALVMSIALGWRLFGPISLVAAGLDPTDEERHSVTVRDLLQRFARMVTETPASATPAKGRKASSGSRRERAGRRSRTSA